MYLFRRSTAVFSVLGLLLIAAFATGAAPVEVPLPVQENYTDSVAMQVLVSVKVLGIEFSSNEGPVGEAEATIGFSDDHNPIGDVDASVPVIGGPIASLTGVEDEAHADLADTEARTTIPALNVLGGLVEVIGLVTSASCERVTVTECEGSTRVERITIGGKTVATGPLPRNKTFMVPTTLTIDPLGLAIPVPITLKFTFNEQIESGDGVIWKQLTVRGLHVTGSANLLLGLVSVKIDLLFATMWTSL